MGGQAATPNYAPMEEMQLDQTAMQGAALANQAQMLQYASKTMPQVYTPNISQENQNILNQAIINANQGKQAEQLLDPNSAAMRQNLSASLKNLTSDQASTQRMNQWLKTSGLQRLFGTGTGLSTIGASGLSDAATEAGYQNMLRNLQLQQQFLGQAPSVGISPQAAASQVEAAQQQGVNAANAFNQNLLQQGSGLIGNTYQADQNSMNAAMQLKAQEIQSQYAANQANQGQLGQILGGVGTVAGGVLGSSISGTPMGGMAGASIGGAAGQGLGAL